MARRVHQIELIGLAVLGFVFQAYSLRLDSDAALALDLHIVEELFLHFALFKPAAELDQAVGQSRFAMVDMRDNREVADMGLRDRIGNAHSLSY